MTNLDPDIFCLTCGVPPDMDAPHTGNWDDYGHMDAGHYPAWSETPTPPRDDANDVALQDTGRNAPRSCRECGRTYGHKMDCTKGRTHEA